MIIDKILCICHIRSMKNIILLLFLYSKAPLSNGGQASSISDYQASSISIVQSSHNVNEALRQLVKNLDTSTKEQELQSEKERLQWEQFLNQIQH